MQSALAAENAAKLGVKRNDTVHWYDFVCPFCYAGQSRSEILKGNGIRIVELLFRAHPEIPERGKSIGVRSGPMYDVLTREAREANLPLDWPHRLPNTRLTLACAEWIREHSSASFANFQSSVFEAHFARHENIGDPTVLDHYATQFGVDLRAMHAALADGSADAALNASEQFGAACGVRGTPAWLVYGKLISGLRPQEEFEEIARSQR